MDAVLSISPSMTPKIHIPQKFGLKIYLPLVLPEGKETQDAHSLRMQNAEFKQMTFFIKLVYGRVMEQN